MRAAKTSDHLPLWCPFSFQCTALEFLGLSWVVRGSVGDLGMTWIRVVNTGEKSSSTLSL